MVLVSDEKTGITRSLLYVGGRQRAGTQRDLDLRLDPAKNQNGGRRTCGTESTSNPSFRESKITVGRGKY